MAKFRIFNIQLLPVSDEIREVGNAGYKKLFATLRDHNARQIAQNRHADFHWKLHGDGLFGPKTFSFEAGYVYGEFQRYKKATRVSDFKTEKTVLPTSRSARQVQDRVNIPYIFDTKRHIFAISEDGLPKRHDAVKALKYLLDQVAVDTFPDHSLTISSVSTHSGLDEVLQQATGYKSAELTLHFPNGGGSTGLLQDLKESHAETLEVTAKAAPNGEMPKLPQLVIELLQKTVTHGRGKITYMVKDAQGKFKKRFFDTESKSQAFQVNKTAAEDEHTFFQRVKKKLDKQSLPDIEDAS